MLLPSINFLSPPPFLYFSYFFPDVWCETKKIAYFFPIFKCLHIPPSGGGAVSQNIYRGLLFYAKNSKTKCFINISSEKNIQIFQDQMRFDYILKASNSRTSKIESVYLFLKIYAISCYLANLYAKKSQILCFSFFVPFVRPVREFFYW